MKKQVSPSIIVLAFIIAVAGALVWGHQVEAVKTCSKCNVILISIDTFSAKHIGLYGYPKPTTPNLDRISKERGIVFENAITQAPWTLPSHTAMLTSRYPHEYKIWNIQDALPDNAKTIAQSMKERGYQTKAFSNGPFVQPEWGFDRGFDSFSGSIKPDDWQDSPKIFQDALSWTKDNSKKPFFMFVHSFQIHLPYRPSAESLKALGADTSYQVELQDVSRANARPTGPTTEENMRFQLAYDAEIRDLDQGIKLFFDGLKEQRLLDKTVVILVADHGEAFGEHGVSGDHLSMNEEVVHVPLIMFLPHTNPRLVSGAVEVRSIPPSILSLTGLPQETSFSQRTLMDALKDKAGDFVAISNSGLDVEEVVKFVGESYDKAISMFGTVIKINPRKENWDKPYGISARSARWHLIKNIGGSIELYNLLNDPLEQKNIYSKWVDLPADERRGALPLFKALGAGVPFECGIYCGRK